MTGNEPVLCCSFQLDVGYHSDGQTGGNHCVL